MKNTLLILIIFFSNKLIGQLTTNNTYTPDQLVNDFLLGSGITATNVQYTGTPDAIGYFNSTSANVGINTGIILNTGTVLTGTDGPAGPNNLAGAGIDNSQPGDTLLANITGLPSFNAARLEFDFIPQSDTVKFNYVFASEEYLEYVGQSVNDAFGFFISGQNPAGGTYVNENIALIPGTTTPITINNVNATLNSAYYINNGNGSSAPQNTDSSYIQYDGLTTKLTAKAAVVCGQSYHIVIVISDIGDGIFDSGVFLEEGSFSSGSVDISINTETGDTSLIEGCLDAAISLIRPGSVSDSLIVTIDVAGTATSGLDYTPINNQIILLPGQDSIAFSITTLLDNLNEGFESIIINAYTITSCGDTIISTGTIWIKDPFCEVSTNNPTFPCPNSNGVWLVANPINGIAPYSFTWSDGSTNDSLFVSTNSSGSFNYSVTMTDFCTASDIDTANIIVQTFNAASFTANPLEGETPLTVTYTNTSSTGNNFSWLYGDGNSNVFPTNQNTTNIFVNEGQYTTTLIVTSIDGCIDTAQIQINAFSTPYLEVPNVFTPNNEGANNYFEFMNVKSVNEFYCKILNRWGNVIHEMNNINEKWDGTDNNNKQVTDGVYFYTYEAKSISGKTINGSGYVQIFR